MGRSTDEEIGLSEQREYRCWTAKQKIEIVLAGLERALGRKTYELELAGKLMREWE